MNPKIKELVQSLIDKGLKPIPLKESTKEPSIKQWQKSEPKIEKFSDSSNIGIRLGEAFLDGYIAALDFDIYDSEQLENIFNSVVEQLKVEPLVWQETASGGKHLFILTNEPVKTEEFQVAENGHVELRGKRHQIVIAPSKAMGKDGVEREYKMHGEFNELKVVESAKIKEVLEAMSTKPKKAEKTKEVIDTEDFQDTDEDIAIKVRAALLTLLNSPNVKNKFDDDKTFIKFLTAAKSAGLSYDDIDMILQQSDNHNYDENVKRFESLKVEGNIGPATLLWFAKDIDADLWNECLNDEFNGSTLSDSDPFEELLEMMNGRYSYDQKTSKYYDHISENLIRRDEIELKLRVALRNAGVQSKMLQSTLEEILLGHRDECTATSHFFKASNGVVHLKGQSKRLEVKGESFILTKDTPYFDIPPFSITSKSEIDKIWKPLCSLFEEPEISKHALMLWFRNLNVSYHGEIRTYPLFVIIQGKQGVGKDRELVSFLTSFIPKQYKHLNGKVSLLTDTREFSALQNYLVVNFPEMERFDRADLNAIKSGVTNETYSYRILATHNYVTYTNCSNFIGTTNQQDFTEILKDSTGARRFAFLRLREDLDWQEMKTVIKQCNIDQLLKTVDPKADLEEHIEVLSKFQHDNMRHKSREEAFAEWLPENFNTDLLEDKHKVEGKKNSTTRTITFTLTTDQVFTYWMAFLKEIGGKNYYHAKSVFSKKVKPYLGQNKFTHDPNNRRYTFIKKINHSVSSISKLMEDDSE